MRRQRVWLVLAVVLFALGAALMLWGQGEEERPEPPRVDFPRRLRQGEVERMTARRTRQVSLPVAEAAGPPQPQDPLLAALPRGKGRTALVFEANALRHSPVGELLLDCMLRDGGSGLAQLKERTGVDPLQDLDRLVVTDDGVILSGNFGKARLAELFEGSDSRQYGDGAKLYAPTLPPSAQGAEPREQPSVASWNDQLLVFSRNPDGAREVVDRVEGRTGADEAPLIDEESTYGEMYGVLSVAQLSKLLGNEQPELLARLGEVADSVELHVDARSDVALVAEVKGEDADKVKDLGKSLGAALSVARLQAQAEGQKELVELLDFARVRPDDGTFQLEVALPLAYLQQKLASCGEERRAAESTRDAGVQPTL
jgi:hypothetical protein